MFEKTLLFSIREKELRSKGYKLRLNRPEPTGCAPFLLLRGTQSNKIPPCCHELLMRQLKIDVLSVWVVTDKL